MRTFVIIKPDAIYHKLIGKIISRFEYADFKIKRIEMLQKDSTWFGQMYSHLTGDVYVKMQNFMLGAPLIGIIFEGPDAVAQVRQMIGCTDSFQAALGTIRGDFGRHPIRFNCVHASDNGAAVTKEIALFFGDNNDQSSC